MPSNATQLSEVRRAFHCTLHAFRADYPLWIPAPSPPFAGHHIDKRACGESVSHVGYNTSNEQILEETHSAR